MNGRKMLATTKTLNGVRFMANGVTWIGEDVRWNAFILERIKGFTAEELEAEVPVPKLTKRMKLLLATVLMIVARKGGRR